MLTVKRTQFADAEYSHLNFDLFINGITHRHHHAGRNILRSSFAISLTDSLCCAVALLLQNYFYDSILKKVDVRMCG